MLIALTLVMVCMPKEASLNLEFMQKREALPFWVGIRRMESAFPAISSKNQYACVRMGRMEKSSFRPTS